MGTLTLIIIIVSCVILSGFFSGSETALMRLRKEHLEKDIQKATGPSAVAVRNLLESSSRLLVTILLGNNLVNIVGASVASVLAVHYLGEEKGIFVSSMVMTLVVLIFSEILPKAVAARAPKEVSYVVGLPLYLIHNLLTPVHFIFDNTIERVVRKLTRGADKISQGSADELLDLARNTEVNTEKGSPIPIIAGAAEAAEKTVEEIMVPCAEIVAYPIETDAHDLLDALLAEHYTRIPIYENDINKVVGLVHLKDLIKLVKSESSDISEILKPVLRVPELKPVLDLLADMQRAFIHMAIVKDEHGMTAGLLTQEDILEEIVGEIRDEFDREELYAIRPIGDHAYESLGRLKVVDFNRQTSWNVDTERGDTLGGLVFNVLGRTPRLRDFIEVGQYRIQVLDISGVRITRVRVTNLEESAE